MKTEWAALCHGIPQGARGGLPGLPGGLLGPLHQPPAQGKHAGMGPVPGPQFADQVAEVTLDRFGCQLETEGDFVIAFAGRRPAQDLPFPCC